MDEPTVNTNGIAALLAGAEGKIRTFREKVTRIDAHVRELEGDRDAVEALLEYIKMAAERRSLLTGLFVHQGEYGTADEVPPEIVDLYEKRLTRRKGRIEQLTKLREMRIKAIEFAERDIELLKKICAVRPSWPPYLDAALGDF